MPDNYIPRVRENVDAEFQRDVRRMFERIQKLQDELTTEIQRVKTVAATPDFGYIRNQLQANGSAQLNVQGLLGQLSQPQPAQATIVAADPVVGDPLRQNGSLVAVKSGGNYTLRIFDASTNAWNNTL